MIESLEGRINELVFGSAELKSRSAEGSLFYGRIMRKLTCDRFLDKTKMHRFANTLPIPLHTPSSQEWVVRINCADPHRHNNILVRPFYCPAHLYFIDPSINAPNKYNNQVNSVFTSCFPIPRRKEVFSMIPFISMPSGPSGGCQPSNPDDVAWIATMVDTNMELQS